MKRILKFASLATVALGLMFVTSASSQAAEFCRVPATRIVKIEHRHHRHVYRTVVVAPCGPRIHCAPVCVR
jgi:hypothetical protein